MELLSELEFWESDKNSEFLIIYCFHEYQGSFVFFGIDLSFIEWLS